MRTRPILPAAMLLLASFAVAQEPAPFQGGFPPPHEAQKARDEADFQRAVTAYRLGVTGRPLQNKDRLERLPRAADLPLVVDGR